MRADVGATLPASRTDELILNIRKPEVASPAIRIHFDRVAALVVGAIDQDAPHAAFAREIFCGRVRTGMAQIPPIGHQGKPLGIGLSGDLATSSRGVGPDVDQALTVLGLARFL
jgi:hypothetical protein